MPHSTDIGFQLHYLSNLLRQRDEYSKTSLHMDDKVSRNNLWILSYLAHNTDRDIFQKDLEIFFCIRRSTVSKVIRLMEDKGYIRREEVAQDARLKKIVLTDSGWTILNFMREERNATEALLRQGVSEEELDIFFRVMKKFRSNIQTH